MATAANPKPSINPAIPRIRATILRSEAAIMNLLNLSWPFLIVLALLITHCIRTGRNSLWIWFMVLAPGIGALAYLAFELVPSLFSSRGTRRAVRNVTSVLDPGQDLRRYELE